MIVVIHVHVLMVIVMMHVDALRLLMMMMMMRTIDDHDDDENNDDVDDDDTQSSSCSIQHMPIFKKQNLFSFPILTIRTVRSHHGDIFAPA